MVPVVGTDVWPPWSVGDQGTTLIRTESLVAIALRSGVVAKVGPEPQVVVQAMPQKLPGGAIDARYRACLCNCLHWLNPEKDSSGATHITTNCDELKEFGDCIRKCLDDSPVSGWLDCPDYPDILIHISAHPDGDTSEATSENSDADLNVAVGGNASKTGSDGKETSSGDGKKGGDATATSSKKGGAAVAVGGSGGKSQTTGQKPGAGGTAKASSSKGGGDATARGGDGGRTTTGDSGDSHASGRGILAPSTNKGGGAGGEGTATSDGGPASGCGGTGGEAPHTGGLPGGKGGKGSAKTASGSADGQGGYGGDGPPTKGGQGGSSTATKGGRNSTTNSGDPSAADGQGGGPNSARK